MKMLIVHEGAEVLNNVAKQVDDIFAPQALQVSEALQDTLIASESGVGLAAPQIGIPLRMFATYLPDPESDGDARIMRVFNNPSIDKRSETIVEAPEGCLSCDGAYNVPRSEWIIASWDGYDMTRHTEKMTGLAARCFQHELDHLDGKLISRFEKISVEE